MSEAEKIRKELVNQQRRLRELERRDIASNDNKVVNIKARIAELRSELLALEESRAGESPGVLQRGTLQSQTVDFVEQVEDFSENMLFSRYTEKYCSEYYFRRDSISAHFLNFLKSDRTAMVVTGKAGVGKSAFVCDMVENPPAGALIWLQDCAYLELDSETSVDEYIGQSLGLSAGVLGISRGFLREHPDQTVVFVFDSVNEFPGRSELLVKLSEFVRSIEEPEIKLLITCRVPIWDSIKRHFAIPLDRGFHIAGPGSYVNIDSFTDEEIAQVYEGYCRAYQIVTPFEKLSIQVRNFITNPLFLKMTAEVYEGKDIPKSLALRDVFTEYVRKCLGEDGFESEEFAVLQRIIELMYEEAKRELELAILKKNGTVGKYVVPDFYSAYTRLLDEGLLSQRVDKRVLRQIELVFVTYERVFEYLLAEIIIGEVTVPEIVRNLELAQTKSFIQLRGAIELALSFSILNDDIDESLLVELARLDRPDSRQFLCDVIQTIYDSGHRESAENIVFHISEDGEYESQLLATQAAYQLRLDERLVSLTLSKNAELRELAAIYLYERWNSTRLEGRLDEGYRLLERLKSFVNLRYPRRSAHVLQALLSVSANMFIHLVDDPESVKPLLDVYKDLVTGIPGVGTDRKDSGLGKLVGDSTANIIVEIVAKVVARIAALDHDLKEVIGRPKVVRAALDIGELFTLDSLTMHKEAVVELLAWNNSFIAYVSSSLVMHQVDYNIEEHLPLFIEIMDSDRLEFTSRLLLFRALVLGLVARSAKGNDVSYDILVMLTDYLVGFWHNLSDSPVVSGADVLTDLNDPGVLWQSALLGMLFIEADTQRRLGTVTGSHIVPDLMRDPEFAEVSSLKILLSALERAAYQGFVDFAILSILDRNTRLHWEREVFGVGIETLANIRALYQQEVDSLLQAEQSADHLWEKVRVVGGRPSPQDIRSISYVLWTMVACATDIQLTKASGLYLLELAFSASVSDFWKRAVRLSMEILSHPTVIDIAHVQWGLAHDPGWDRFEKLKIPRSILDISSEAHERYGGLAEACIATCGRGILYEEAESPFR